MIFTPEMKQQIIDSSKGKIISSLEYDDEDKYWIMNFEDGSEMCFRFMSELI